MKGVRKRTCKCGATFQSKEPACRHCMGSYVCTGCNTRKPNSAFRVKDSRVSISYDTRCRVCRQAVESKRRKLKRQMWAGSGQKRRSGRTLKTPYTSEAEILDTLGIDGHLRTVYEAAKPLYQYHSTYSDKPPKGAPKRNPNMPTPMDIIEKRLRCPHKQTTVANALVHLGRLEAGLVEEAA